MFNDTIVDVEGGQLEGTAPYMSPGVAAGNAEDTRCDIYAFGALLYEMLTGEPPYAGRNTNDIRKQILAGPPKPIRARNPGADAGLVAVAEGAMARELRDRYADMADVLADLERINAGKATRGTAWYFAPCKTAPDIAVDSRRSGHDRLGLWLLWPPRPQKSLQNRPRPIRRVQFLPVSILRQPAPSVVPQSEWRVSILAGQPGAHGSADGAASDARFQSPGGIAVDTSGNVYVADTGNNTIRRSRAAARSAPWPGWRASRAATDGSGNAARFLAPLGIAVDRAGNIYVAEFASDIIRKITPEGVGQHPGRFSRQSRQHRRHGRQRPLPQSLERCS